MTPVDRWMIWVFPGVLALLATPIMSGLVTAYNLGVGPDFLSRWFDAWLVSLPAGLLVVYVISPVARRMTAAAVRAAVRGRERRSASG